MGGFTEEYRAVRKVFSIHPRRSWNEGELSVVRHANLIDRRGDVGVTVDADESFAYVSGGSSHTNSFCGPLSTVEKYDLENNTWAEVAPLTTARTGKTVLQLNDQLVALGGAQQISKLCNKTSADLFDIQTPVYEVEVYDENSTEWNIVDNLAGYRFRSTTVVFNGTVYSFGGQSVYFPVCQCHPTVDSVVTYKEVKGLETPGQPGDTFANENTYDFDFQNQQAGADNMYPPMNTDYDNTDYGNTDYGNADYYDNVDNEEDIEQKGNFEEDSKYIEEDGKPSRTYGEDSGFGAYHRDGFTGASSGNIIALPSFLYTAIIGVLAAIVL